MIDLLRKIFLVDLLKGLWVTLTYTPQPAFTFQYPLERRPTAPRFRGVLRLQVEPDTGAQTCIVCDQCAKACPDGLISLGGHREPGQKLKALDYFDFNLSRCSFCGLCSEVCPTKPIKALIMSEDYELGTYSRDAQILRIDQMYDGVPIGGDEARRLAEEATEERSIIPRRGTKILVPTSGEPHALEALRRVPDHAPSLAVAAVPMLAIVRISPGSPPADRRATYVSKGGSPSRWSGPPTRSSAARDRGFCTATSTAGRSTCRPTRPAMRCFC